MCMERHDLTSAMPMRSSSSLIDAKNARRYDDCLKYTVVSGRKALIQAGLDRERNPEGYAKLDVARVGVLIGTGMGGLTVFQDGEQGRQGGGIPLDGF